MDCFAFCTAASYNLKQLHEALRHQHKSSFHRDVLHIETVIENSAVDFFFFSFGSVVSWGADKNSCLNFIQCAQSFEIQPYKELEADEFIYFYGVGPVKIAEDEISLPDEDCLIKLAISYAIAQSVKLESFETSLQRTFSQTKHLPENLAAQGRIFLSRREIRRITGRLFLERSSINLYLDVLDTPEIFWEYPELEPYYKVAAVYLDLNPRVEVLNHRLSILHELLEMLGNELNHQHSSRLEWTIILLIVIEVVLTVSKDILKWI